jgi:Protein of unknown function DUF262
MVEKNIFKKENDNDVDIPKEERKLINISYDYSVEFIISLMGGDQPKVILEVPFQRKFVWKTDRASQLIESIIMSVPIPPLYFSEEENGRWLIVDGLQRLHSLKSYFDNEFALKKLEIIKELEGKKYKDLPPKARSLLKDGSLRINVIKYESHPDIKYDIFMRLNKGAVILNNQELRNCLYRGTLNESLKKMTKESVVQTVLNIKAPHTRYLDVEFLVRYLSFSVNISHNENGYYIKKYKGSLKSFINNFMEENKNAREDLIQSFEKKIQETFMKIIAVFEDGKGLLNPTSKSTQINKAFAECILLSFENYKKETLEAKKSEIINLKNNILKDETFSACISKRTSDNEVIKKRLTIWFGGMKNVFGF